jgi:hypothetical protein
MVRLSLNCGEAARFGGLQMPGTSILGSGRYRKCEAVGDAKLKTGLVEGFVKVTVASLLMTLLLSTFHAGIIKRPWPWIEPEQLQYDY